MKKIVNVMAVLLIIPLISGCAAMALGGAGAVGYSGVQERTIGNAVDDNVIEAEILSSFVQKKIEGLFVNVGVQVTEGRVLLTGTVQDPEDSVEAVKLSWQPKGVKEVINEIQVSNKSSVNDVAKDSWITTQVKSKLLITKGIKSINYNVETVNGVVYLIGLAENADELDKATLVASTIKGVKKVVSHVRLYNDDRRQ